MSGLEKLVQHYEMVLARLGLICAVNKLSSAPLLISESGEHGPFLITTLVCLSPSQ